MTLPRQRFGPDVQSPPNGVAQYRVRHHYRYVYTASVFNVKQRLIMIPPDQHLDQQLVSFDLDVRGPTGQLSIDWQSDVFGNRVCRVDAERVDHALDFEAWFSVRHVDPQPPTESAAALHAYRSFTALTAADERIRAEAQTIQSQASEPAAGHGFMLQAQPAQRPRRHGLCRLAQRRADG